jgi:hypothetical protein
MLQSNCSQTEMRIDDADLTTRWLYSHDGWWHLLSQARVMASLFSVALCLGGYGLQRGTCGSLGTFAASTVIDSKPGGGALPYASPAIFHKNLKRRGNYANNRTRE